MAREKYPRAPQVTAPEVMCAKPGKLSKKCAGTCTFEEFGGLGRGAIGTGIDDQVDVVVGEPDFLDRNCMEPCGISEDCFVEGFDMGVKEYVVAVFAGEDHMEGRWQGIGSGFSDVNFGWLL